MSWKSVQSLSTTTLALTALTTAIVSTPGLAQNSPEVSDLDADPAIASETLPTLTPLTPLTPLTQVPLQPVPIPSDLDPRSLLYEDTYLLGTGDEIIIDIFNVPEFSAENGRHVVLIDGTINVPWLGNVYVEGLTVSQAASLLETEYSPYINDPLITVKLLTPRPLRISIVGEVNRPGSYNLVPTDLAGGGDDPLAPLTDAGQNQWSSVVQAIQNAGGITATADIRQIQIRRPSRIEEEEIITVDLWQLLQTGDLAQDLTLRDGDTIFIPEVLALTPEETLEIASANFSPELINTYVVGEVLTPGMLELQPGTPLNQAILAAGGFVNNRAGDVELVRLNSDGSVDRLEIDDVEFEDDLNDETNPALRHNDIIVVGRSSGARITDFLDAVATPVVDVLDILGIFDIFD